MTTARDVITGAYRRLGLLPLGANLDPARAIAGLQAYGGMLSAWAADGIIAGSVTPETADLDDDFPLPPRFVEGAKALLAVELASESGIEAQTSIQSRAKKAYAAMLAAFVCAPSAAQDRALTALPSQRR
ncbi:hypothetical protein JDN40_03095 [Rhodomicrobium vannielii ATCC 17100]|uniref:hypothetical protein n=1 Tax=Rhodomicrobium vannielii TaxID=1069 RepID=UPI00191B0280|nr:hypothetical protein [Rhodomicrobium vannielii]MBJ7533099.1 hypothetical protein [Rhodomicrobium vannielii ATCC 17100]